MNKFKLSYNKGDGLVEVIVRDETGAKLEQYKVNWADTKKHGEIAKRLKDKYGIDFISTDDFFTM